MVICQLFLVLLSTGGTNTQLCFSNGLEMRSLDVPLVTT